MIRSAATLGTRCLESDGLMSCRQGTCLEPSTALIDLPAIQFISQSFITTIKIFIRLSTLLTNYKRSIITWISQTVINFYKNNEIGAKILLFITKLSEAIWYTRQGERTFETMDNLELHCNL
ncbi:unnamed protein product [Trichogramma brassicae]|uniref:Uncharacterized protein n=1 Tax=Trichogramma brassicae TaxID=86971 RepID=A0A6H5ISC2_9HYME|nr:unnamed protein product [Trichogramma brassicae]